MAGAIGGCSVGGGGQTADDLRRMLQDANDQIASITAERNELRVKLAEAERALATARPEMPEGVLSALPRCAAIELDKLTGPVDTDQTRGYDAIDVYVRALDGRRRVIQVVGTLSIRADLVPDPYADQNAPAAAPTNLAQITLSPVQLREAYRSGMTGTHYAIRLPLERPDQPLGGSLAITVRLVDGLSGEIFRADQVRPVPALKK